MVGYLSEDAEDPGLWTIEDTNGRFMDRSAVADQGAAFPAAWFTVQEPDWS